MSVSRQVRRAQERKAKVPPSPARAAPTERLVACALIRDGVTHSRGFKEHWQIRAALGDANPHTKNPADEYGFITDAGRFLTRREAVKVGAAAGQCQMMERELLSSDINWERTL